jgi:catechol 2,3-dioxygenase-like lactoylglutathione lyase family enzyme
MAGSVAFNHVGQCVADLDRSKRFYVELLGFTLEREIQPPDELTGQLLQLPPPLGMTACYLRRDGFVLELLHFASLALRPREPRAMNELGLTHVSVSVDDVERVLGAVAAYGGEVLTGTNIGAGVFVRDPDGQLLEILPMSYRVSLDAGREAT